jgi:hypothetical protein
VHVRVHDDEAVSGCECEYGEKTGVANVNFRTGAEDVAILMP